MQRLRNALILGLLSLMLTLGGGGLALAQDTANQPAAATEQEEPGPDRSWLGLIGLVGLLGLAGLGGRTRNADSGTRADTGSRRR